MPRETKGQGARGAGEATSGPGVLAPLPGDLVRVRDREWRVTRTRRHGEVTALALGGLEPDNRHDARTVLAPFEHILPIARSARPHRVPLGRWLRGLVALGLHDGPYELPRAAALARVALLPYQLAPALAVLNGQASRLLVADEVGLGKTVQAAILLRELTDRDLVRRALIVVPASLREQWQGELATRVDIRAELRDASWAVRVGRTLPPDTNPWRLPSVCLVSHDYVKQPEVLNAVAACSWDLVIIDEAHTLTPPTWRAEAGQRLGRAARWLLLLTATPHRGDEAAFRALCDTGRLGHDDVVVMFRRRREDVGLPRARVTRLLRVRPSMAEVHLHAELTRYAARVWAEPSVSAGARLTTVVLTKRALSSASSLARSLQRRLALLDAERPSRDAEQLPLPLDARLESPCPDDEVSDAVLMAPGLSDRRLERRWLATLGTLAVRAQQAERKRAALVRLVRRTREPLVVFTEYRDTLAMLVRALERVAATAVLHGAQAPQERRDALSRFGDGRARVLVATDAASEGLNLHARCRLVVVYELPWNPNRLEQRIGRVDRLGQARRVHAVELVLAGSREDTVLTRLRARLSRIARTLDPFLETPAAVTSGAPRAAPMAYDRAMRTLESAMVTGSQGNIADPLQDTAREPRLEPTHVVTTRDQEDPREQPDDLSAFLSRLDLDEQSRRACAELRRLRQLTALWGGKTPHVEEISRMGAHMRRRAPWTAVVDSRRRVRHGLRISRPRGTAQRPGATLVLLFVTELQDTSGRALVSVPTTLAGPCSALHSAAAAASLPFAIRRGTLIGPFIEALIANPHLCARVAGAADSAIAAARDADERLLTRLRQRERRMHGERARLARPHGPDLFGRLRSPMARAMRAATDTGMIAPAETRYVTRVSLQLALLIPDS